MTTIATVLILVLGFAGPAFAQNIVERFWMTITGPDGENISLGNVVSTPEPRALRQLGLGTHRLLNPVKAAIAPALQRATAFGATAILVASGLHATRSGTLIALPSTTLDVTPGCSGIAIMRTLVLLACVGGLWLSWRRSWKVALALLVAAPLIGLAMNMLRVASVGYGLEVYGWNSEHPTEWGGWVTFGLGTALLLGLGAILNRARR